MKKRVTLNREQRLYVIPEAGGYTCLGFDVAKGRAERLAAELKARGHKVPELSRAGSLKLYGQYQELSDLAKLDYDQRGMRCECELTPELKGLEGERVEVVTKTGEKVRFQVGKSTGWIPIHLAIRNSRCSGGEAVFGTPFFSVMVLERKSRFVARYV